MVGLEALEDEPLESHNRGPGSRPITVLRDKMK